MWLIAPPPIPHCCFTLSTPLPHRFPSWPWPGHLQAYPKQQEDLQRLVDKMQNPEARYALFLEPNSKRVPRFKLFL